MNRVATILIGLGVSMMAALVVLPSVLELDRKPMTLVSDSSKSADFAQLGADIDPGLPVPEGWDTFSSVDLPSVPDRHCDGEEAQACIVHSAAGPHVLLIGDSHADRIAPALLALAEEHGFTLSISAVASCRWQVGLAPEDFRMEDCYAMRDDLYERVLPALHPDIVLTVSVGLAPVGVRDPRLEELSLRELVQRTTRESVDLILTHATELVLLEPLPLPGFDMPACFSGAETVGECAFEYSYVPGVHGDLISTYATIYRAESLNNPRITSAPYDRLVCVNGSPCIPLEDGIATFTDSHHLNAVQAFEHRERLWEVLAPVIRNVDSLSSDAG